MMDIFNLKQKIKRSQIHKIKKSNQLLVSDTTLRDGEQMPEVFFTPENKIKIANYLAKMGVHSIDAGFPVCSEGEKKCVKAVADNVKGITEPVISALCRAKKQDIDASYDVLKNLSSIRRGVTISLGTSSEQREKLGKTKQEIIEMTRDSVNYASKYFDIISFGPEDASRTELDFLVDLYSEAIKSGASVIGFSDTVGILDPEETISQIEYINKNTKGIENILLAIHFHNDLGMAVANSLAAIKTGYVNIFQGTIGGIGERSGNTAIESVVMALNLKDYGKKTKIKTKMFHEAFELIQKLSRVDFSPFTPIIGKNIFRTEAGIHQDGILKNPKTYEIFPPETVGVKQREFVIGKHSGRHAIFTKLEELGSVIENDQKIYGQRVYCNVKAYCDLNGAISDSKLLEIAKNTKKTEKDE